MASTIISPDELNALMASVDSLVLLDVRLEDDFKYQHIPKAQSNAVFEMAFTERVESLVADKSTPICVYGSRDGSSESAVATAKLVRLGYSRVYDLSKGIESWSSSGHAIVEAGGSQPQSPKLADGVYVVDLEHSLLSWVGRNLLNSHRGTIAIVSGAVEIQGGKLFDAKLELDFTQIKCTDLEGSEWHDVLIAHLESDDFFDTEQFPKGGFQLTDTEKLGELGLGSLNLRMGGDLMMRGEVHPVSCDAAAGVDENGYPVMQAVFVIDRTHWGIRYGSGKFFSRLASHLVNDQIEIELKLVTKK